MAKERIFSGSSRPQKKHLEALAKAYQQGEVSLFLGAGISIPFGLPTWEELVIGLLLNEAGDDLDLDTAAREIQEKAEEDLQRRRAANPSSAIQERWQKKDPEDVKYALEKALEQAHTYDRQLFKDLGINTLWVKTYADMPAVVKWVRERAAEL